MNRWKPMGKMLLAILVNLIIVGAVFLVLQLAGTMPGNPKMPWWAGVAVLLMNPLVSLAALGLWRLEKRPFAEFGYGMGFGAGARRLTLWLSVLTVALLLGFVGFTSVSGLIAWRFSTETMVGQVLGGTAMFMLVGLGEEFMWRGYIMPVLKPYGTGAAVAINSVLFALIHLINGNVPVIHLVALALHGAFFAYLAMQTRSIWSAVIVHGIYDVATMLIWGAAPTAAVLLFDGDITFAKYLFKCIMIVPMFGLVWWATRGRQASVQAGAARV